ncbi:unnamed protein product [Lactuca virosa]|uniref:Myb-like domain-containing protein n=1 Tax=Lactuca virosa TaxID=75947 RepID=A0AAU9MTD9_9ASTR|nr:unnamed protein product [Lactuca virosa]
MTDVWNPPRNVRIKFIIVLSLKRHNNIFRLFLSSIAQQLTRLFGILYLLSGSLNHQLCDFTKLLSLFGYFVFSPIGVSASLRVSKHGYFLSSFVLGVRNSLRFVAQTLHNFNTIFLIILLSITNQSIVMDTGFHHQQTSSLNQQAISFQSSPRDSKSEISMIGGLDFHRMNGTHGMIFSGNSAIVNNSSSTFTGIGNSCDSIIVDSVPELKHRAGVAVEWSVEEQHKLEEALLKYADEPGIIRYVKIAATLRNKTVRDVALRCRWMARKRRKHEEFSLWKKSKDKKDKLVEFSSKPSVVPPISTFNVAPFSVSMNNRVQADGNHVEALQGSIRHLLEQNKQVIGQISTNMCALKLQDNVNLFSQMKNNISAILNDMRFIPGPPLPVSLNEDLANTILSTKNQTMMFTSSSGMHMKQEPGSW